MQYIVYVGTYTQGNSKGIYRFLFDGDSGILKEKELVAKAENPSYFIVNKGETFLYCVYETDNYEDSSGGGIGSYKIDKKTGALKKINQQLVKGKAPCHLCVNSLNEKLFTANYNSGSVSAFSIKSDGSIGTFLDYVEHTGNGPNQDRQVGPHAHFVGITPEENNLCVADLGIDQLKFYEIDHPKRCLVSLEEQTIQLEPGVGPRHFVFHQELKSLYVVNELKACIMVFKNSAKNKLELIQRISTIPDIFQGENFCSAIKITPNGDFLYVANRGHNSLAGYQIDKESGKLELISIYDTLGEWPRDFEIDPTGKWLFVANQNSDEVTIFSIEKQTGILSYKDKVVGISDPVCIKIIALEKLSL